LYIAATRTKPEKMTMGILQNKKDRKGSQNAKAEELRNKGEVKRGLIQFIVAKGLSPISMWGPANVEKGDLVWEKTRIMENGKRGGPRLKTLTWKVKTT